MSCQGAPSNLEHRIAVRGLGGDTLKHVPMLHDLAVGVEAENIDPRPVSVVRPVLIAVEHHVVAFGDHAPELDPLAGILLAHSNEIIDKCLLAVSDTRIVLDVNVA